jgi:hypothetical protein
MNFNQRYVGKKIINFFENMKGILKNNNKENLILL